MPAPTTSEEFLELVRKSGVVEEKRLAAFIDRARAGEPLPADPLPFATQLVREGVLTHFQAEQFLQGKWRRFTIGKYKVLERLGAGGMGSVYLCEHMLMRRRVAVKVLPESKSQDTSSLARFYREARAVAALDHPNIVRAYDIDQDDKLHFLVMEHVDGASLQEIVKRAGPLSVLRAAHYMRQAALGLQHAHETAALVHRDIKPGNILVDRNGVVKVLDMGLARFFHDEEDQLTKKFDENVLGTADYLSPEQALESHTVDIRGDIYSLGATFYYCLTGRTPFAEGSVAQKLIWHQTRAPKPIRTFRAEIPDGIVAIIDKMMAKAAADRFQSPQELADALAPWTQTPIPPPPEAEMPQFSLAATRPLTETGAASLTSRPPSDASPTPRKVWQVSGASTHGAATATVTTPRPAAAPSAAPVREARPAPAPAPAVPQSPVPAARAHAPAAPAAAPAPRVEARPAPAASVPRAEPAPPAAKPDSGNHAPVNGSARTAPPKQAEEAQSEPPDDEPDDLHFQAEPVRRRRPAGPRRNQAPVKKTLWLLWALIGGAVLLACGVIGLVSYLVLKPEPPGPAPVVKAREPLRVNASTPLGLSGALKNAHPGDRILLETDILECDLSVRQPNVTIEGAPGKMITWRCPDRAKAEERPKLLIIESKGGVTVKNVTMDGAGKTEALVMFFGKCPGSKLEGVKLRNSKDFGVAFVNCEGDPNNPAAVVDSDIFTTPNMTGVRFLIGQAHATIHVNRHIALRNCNIEGPGPKLTTPREADIDPKTIALPLGLDIAVKP
jgi:serine/threonine protein kinase